MSEPSSSRKGNLALDFKSATLYAMRVVLHSADTSQLLAALDQRMRDAGAFFENEPVVVDATLVDSTVDWPALLDALRGHSLHPVGVVAEGANLEAAQAQGMAPVDLANPIPRPASPAVAEKDIPVVAPPPSSPAEAIAEAPPPPAAPPKAPEIAPAAMVITRPLRSGQRVYARNTDLIVIGVVSQGAEVIADGNIHVYGPLRGKAMAGARGDASCRIFTTQLDPELLAIAGVYRVIETRLDRSLHNAAAIVELQGDHLNILPLGQ